ncbi:MarR family winged helix-turn-helix transcriptional regulator [Frondihabitans cladoniiphilus]|uniref:HTH marR-type domain-containing protein n=1 Tax=Frondihabitans cladoniiphilus TaxID=715785 RepID=A0ABP8WDI8_9MICO
MDDESSLEGSGASSANDLSSRVRSTVGRLSRRFRAERPEGELGDKALEVLTFLDKRGPHSLTELSEAAQVAPASMSQSVNRLTSAGYAVRTPDDRDGRRVLFTTTPAGTDLAVATQARRNAWLSARLDELSGPEQDVVARACALLDRIAES